MGNFVKCVRKNCNVIPKNLFQLPTKNATQVHYRGFSI